MTQQVVNVGSLPGDGTGDKGQVPFSKVNANFTDLYDSALYFGTDSGTLNASVVTIVAPIPATFILDVGTVVFFRPAAANSGPATVNVQASGTIAITNTIGGALSGGELQTTAILGMMYTGSAWQILSPSTAALVSALLGAGAIGQAINPITAAETAAGVTPVNFQYPTLSVDRYATNTTPGTTPMAAAGFQAAINVAYYAGGGTVTYGLTAPYLLEQALNCTWGGSANFGGLCIQNVGGISVDGSEGLLAVHTGKAVFDFTGMDSPVLQDVAIRASNSATYPVTGVMMARNSHSDTSFGRFNNVRIIGNFSTACYYNYGCENEQHLGCLYENYTPLGNTKVVVISSKNVLGITTSFTTDPLGNPLTPFSGGISTTDHNFIGCQVYNGAGFSNSDCYYLDAVDSFRVYGGWAGTFAAPPLAPSAGRAVIYVDTTNGASNFCTVDGLINESTSPLQNFGILVGAQTAATLTSWHIKNYKALNGAYALASAATGPVMDNLRISNMPFTGSSGAGINWVGTIQNSNLDVDAIGVAAVTMSNTVYAGDSSRLIINGTAYGQGGGNATNITIIENGTVNHAFAPGIPATTSGTWTISGTVSQSGRFLFTGNMAQFTIVFGASGSVAYTAGTTLTLPFSALDYATATVTDTSTGLSLGTGIILGTTLTLPVALTTNAHRIVIEGFAYVS